jgi:CTP:molybdopterin cytidylyltransferase MocA
MVRATIIPLVAGLVLALAACGSDDAGGGAASVVPEDAKNRIERAAQVELVAEPVPDDAREQGLEASFSNAATAVKDKQVVALFVLEDADVADEVSDKVRASAPASAKLIVDGEVMVVYAAAGADRAAAVEKAVKAL